MVYGLNERRIGAYFFMFILVISLVPMAFADSHDLSEIDVEVEELESELEDVEAGSTPDDALYGIDVALDSVRYALSRNKEDVGLLIAEERLEELKELSKEGKIDAAEKARKRHEDALTRVKIRIEKRLAEGEDEDALRDSVKIDRAITLQEGELAELKDRLANLTPEEKREIIEFLIGSEDSLGRFRVEINDAEERSLIKFEEKLGRSRFELRDELNRYREDKRIQAEIAGDKSLIKVEYRFKVRSEDGNASRQTVDRVVNKVLEEVATSREEARRLTKIEGRSGDRGDIDKEGLEAEIEVLKAERLALIEDKEDLTRERKALKARVLDAKRVDAVKVASITGRVTDNVTDDDEDSESDSDSESGSDDDSDDEGSESGSDDSDDDDGHERIQLKINMKEKDGRFEAEAKFRMRFVSGNSEEEIYASIVERTNALTFEELMAIAEIEHEIESDEDSDSDGDDDGDSDDDSGKDDDDDDDGDSDDDSGKDDGGDSDDDGDSGDGDSDDNNSSDNGDDDSVDDDSNDNSSDNSGSGSSN